LFVFSAGNLTPPDIGAVDGSGGPPDSILSPATAKNVITVGALEQPRFINAKVPVCTTVDNTNSCVTNMPWLGMTDTSDEVASFSARGNVGIGVEGNFGRVKPDLVAPGTFVISARSGQWDQVAYYLTHQYFYDTDLLVSNRNSVAGAFFVPTNAVVLTIRLNDRRFPGAFPNLPILYGSTFPPTSPAFDQVTV